MVGERLGILTALRSTSPHLPPAETVSLPVVFPTSAGWVPFPTLSIVCRVGTTATAAITRRLRSQRLSLSGPLYSKQGAGTTIEGMRYTSGATVLGFVDMLLVQQYLDTQYLY